MKKALWITAALLLVSLTGCSGSTEPEAKESSLPQTVIEESSTEAEPIAESETVSFSAGNEADEPAENSEESKESPTTTLSEPEAEPTATEEPPKPTAPPQEPKSMEQPQTEPTAPVPTEPPVTEEPAPEPPEEIPAFDIDEWISYAQGYASDVGLNLESSAVDCWDNPITAGPHSTCLKRDIESRLNRYSRDAEITDVWIWAEPHKDGSYDLYIGYS